MGRSTPCRPDHRRLSDVTVEWTTLGQYLEHLAPRRIGERRLPGRHGTVRAHELARPTSTPPRPARAHARLVRQALHEGAMG